MRELEKRIIEAGLVKGSQSLEDYKKSKKLIQGENYEDAIYFITEYLNV